MYKRNARKFYHKSKIYYVLKSFVSKQLGINMLSLFRKKKTLSYFCKDNIDFISNMIDDLKVILIHFCSLSIDKLPNKNKNNKNL